METRISDSHLVTVPISAVYHRSQVASRWLSGLQKKSQDNIPNWYHLQKKPKKSPQNNTVQGSCLRLFSLPVKDLKGWKRLEYKRRQQRNLRQQRTESALEKHVCWVRKHMHTAGTQRKRPHQPARQPDCLGSALFVGFLVMLVISILNPLIWSWQWLSEVEFLLFWCWCSCGLVSAHPALWDCDGAGGQEVHSKEANC